MSNSFINVRAHKYDLPTCQRRLRHLISIVVRNLTVLIGCDINTVQTYFTIHCDEKSKAFYTSEKITGSVNPTWKSFNVNHLSLSDTDAAKSEFVVRIWRGKDEDFQLVIQWKLDLFGLVYIGQSIQRDGETYGANTMIFGLVDGYYGPPSKKDAITQDVTKSVIKVDQSSVRESYCINSLMRIQTVLRAIKQTHNSVRKVRSCIEQQLASSKAKAEKKHDAEMLMLGVSQLQRDLQWRTSQLQMEKEALETQQATSHQKDVLLKTKFETLQKDKDRLHDKKRGYFDVREDLIKTGAQLVMRRKQLLSELALIYPITEHQDGVFRICGVRLPNSEDFGGQDEVMVAVALGYTCHLVHMISTFLDVPLRYNMDHQGSRSRIHDHILHKLSIKDRDFPLYSKGRERFQFNYGVYLLNKNIGQMRYYCGLGTTDLRPTLPNLKTLLELRLGVKFETSGSKLNVMPGNYIPVPPNLGGPQRLTSALPQPHATRDQPTHQKVPSDASSDIKFEQLLNEVKQQQTMSPETGMPGTQSPRAESPNNLLSDKVNAEQRVLNSDAASTENAEREMFKPSDDTFFESAAGPSGSSSSGEFEVEIGCEAAEEASGMNTRWQHPGAAAQPTAGLLDDDELLSASPPEANSVCFQDNIEERTSMLQTTMSTFKLRKPVAETPGGLSNKDIADSNNKLPQSLTHNATVSKS